MTNMMGVGPFITIPLLMTALGGPQAMLGWLVALLIVIPDGMVWSELGAAMPGSGGSYVYLREGFGREKWGRLMAFLFIWQFILSGPLEIASGYIGFAQYLGLPLAVSDDGALRADRGGGGRAQRRAAVPAHRSLGPLTVTLWVGTPAHHGGGDRHRRDALRSRGSRSTFRRARSISRSAFCLGLGAASRVGIYDYLGYYDICYIGDEVKNPGRVDPALDPHQHRAASR